MDAFIAKKLMMHLLATDSFSIADFLKRNYEQVSICGVYRMKSVMISSHFEIFNAKKTILSSERVSL